MLENELRLLLIFGGFCILLVIYLLHNRNYELDEEDSLSDAEALDDISLDTGHDETDITLTQLQQYWDSDHGESDGFDKSYTEDIFYKPQVKQPSQFTLPLKRESEQKLIVLYLNTEKSFSGNSLVNIMQQYGLVLGEKEVFEKRFNHFSEQHVLFYVANMYEPGTFEALKIDSLQVNGLTFIMQLPVVIDGIKALNIMLQLSQDISERVKGVVLDSEKNQLTAKSIKEIRNTVYEFDKRTPNTEEDIFS